MSLSNHGGGVTTTSNNGSFTHQQQQHHSRHALIKQESAEIDENSAQPMSPDTLQPLPSSSHHSHNNNNQQQSPQQYHPSDRDRGGGSGSSKLTSSSPPSIPASSSVTTTGGRSMMMTLDPLYLSAPSPPPPSLSNSSSSVSLMSGVTPTPAPTPNTVVPSPSMSLPASSSASSVSSSASPDVVMQHSASSGSLSTVNRAASPSVLSTSQNLNPNMGMSQSNHHHQHRGALVPSSSAPSGLGSGGGISGSSSMGAINGSTSSSGPVSTNSIATASGTANTAALAASGANTCGGAIQALTNKGKSYSGGLGRNVFSSGTPAVSGVTLPPLQQATSTAPLQPSSTLPLGGPTKDTRDPRALPARHSRDTRAHDTRPQNPADSGQNSLMSWLEPLPHTIRANGVVYSVDKVVGNGSFGIVLLGHCEVGGELVAIKRVLQDKRYKNRELQIMRALHHPNIVDLKNSFYIQGPKGDDVYLNLVLEYVPETLYKCSRDYVKRKQQFPIPLVKLYMYQLARALGYIHAFNVCHRDIKPQNLLVDPSTGILKLIDFGSAKVLQKGETNVSYICSRYYRAPELIFGASNYSTAVDVWSMGCVMAELIIGQPLFPGETSVDQLVEIIKVLGTPTCEQIQSMNKSYPSYNFPDLKPHPWKLVFKNGTPEAIDLLARILTYTPAKRPLAFEICAHTFFDELRNGNYVYDSSGTPMPALFNFTNDEMSIIKHLGLEQALSPHKRSSRSASPIPIITLAPPASTSSQALTGGSSGGSSSSSSSTTAATTSTNPAILPLQPIAHSHNHNNQPPQMPQHSHKS